MVKTLENSFEDFMNFIDSLSSESVIKDLEELGVVFGECNETETYAVDNISEDITEFTYHSNDILLCA